MSRTLARWGRSLRSDPYRLALLALTLLYIVVFTGLAWDFHAGMRTHKADLGQIDQAIWNSSRGHWLAQTDNGFIATRLTDHVEPILVLISPIYWVWDDVRALLLLQVVAVAAGVLPLYALANLLFASLLAPAQRAHIWEVEPLRQGTRPLAFALSVAYLLAPQLQSAVLTEFHAAPLAVPLILWAFWAVAARRWGQFLLAAVLTALAKEELALLAAGLGAWALWRTWWESRHAPDPSTGTANAAMTQPPGHAAGHRWGYAAGAAVLVGALAWFCVATFVIVPANAAPLYGVAESTYFQRYGALGDTSADIVKSFFTQPQVVLRIAAEPARLAYLAGLLAAFAWLAMLAPDVLLLSLPVLLANLLSAYPAQYYGEFHYSAPLVPYFAVAAAYGLSRLWRWLWRWTDRRAAAFQHLPAANSGTMAAVALAQNAATAVRPLLSVALVVWILAWSLGNYVLHGRGPLAGRYDPTPVTAHHRLLDRFTAQLPPDAAVTATAAVHPHVSHRPYVYQFPLGPAAPVPAEWALLDVTTNTDLAPGDLKTQVDELLAGDWGVVDAADGFLLLHKGTAAKTIPDAFYSFVRTGQATTATGAPLQLLDVRAEDWPRWRQTRLVAEWQVGPGYDPAATPPTLDVVNPAGDALATLGTAAPPALTWYPPERWQPGDVVRVTTLPLALPRAFAVRAAGGDPQQPAVFLRNRSDRSDRLEQLPPLAATTAPDAALNALLGSTAASPVAHFTLPDGRTASVQGWLPDATVASGEPVNLWLRWTFDGSAEWPPGLATFVHLRQVDYIVAQHDGQPQWFGQPAPALADATGGVLHDGRQLTLPNGVAAGAELAVVIGVYDPATGQRLPLTDASGTPLGEELVLGHLRLVAPPSPDQACALQPAACP